jgi:CheY-like chemotaxis protein
LPQATPDYEDRRGDNQLTPAKKILVVDDNVDVADSLGQALEAAGHSVSVATDAVQALAFAGEAVPDVVILDIEMPVMNGYELALRLHAILQSASPLFIALTGYGQAHDQRQSHESGFHHHLVKPVDIDQLLKLVIEGSGDTRLRNVSYR